MCLAPNCGRSRFRRPLREIAAFGPGVGPYSSDILMSLEREERHLPRLIAACYVANFLLGGTGLLYPTNSFGQLFSWQWGSLLFMAGSSLFAAKLATDRWHISSAGFILL